MSENVNVATEVGVKTELEDTERAKIRAPRTKRGNPGATSRSSWWRSASRCHCCS